MKHILFVAGIFAFSFYANAQCPSSIASLGVGNGLQVCWFSGEAPGLLDSIVYDNIDYAGNFVNGGSGDCWRTSDAATLDVYGNHQVEFLLAGSKIICDLFDGLVDPIPSNLSVKYNYWKLKKENGKVLVLWGTSEEENNDYFSIERSTDGINFNQIGILYGKETGNTYLYSDSESSFLSGVMYYRLKQVDFDGHESFSSIKVIELEPEVHGNLNIYPNPVTDILNVKADVDNASDIRISIYNVWGQTVIEVLKTSDFNHHTMSLNTHNLISGYYIIELHSSDFTTQQKFFKN